MKRRPLIAVLVLCLCQTLFAACLGGGDTEPTQQLITVARGDITLSISGSGNISTAEEERLFFGASGTVTDVLVVEDEKVISGQELARLDTGPLELGVTQAEIGVVQAEMGSGQAGVSLKQAQAALFQAEATQLQVQEAYDGVEDLVKILKNFYDENSDQVKTAKEQLEIARLQLEAANSQLSAARLQVELSQLQFELADLQATAAQQALNEAKKQRDKATITAPFDGVVVSVDINEGDNLTPAVPAMYLIDLGSMELKAEVDEIDVAQIRMGQTALAAIDALPDLTLEGKVSSISLLPRMSAGLIVYEVTINFAVPEESGLRAGMSATADIIIDQRSDILLVPERAIGTDSQGNNVVMVQAGEEVATRTVVTGLSDGLYAEIVSGLSEGETVVIVSRSSGSDSGGLFF